MRNEKRKASVILAATACVGIYGLAPGNASGVNATWASPAATSFWNNSADWSSSGAAYLPAANDVLFFGTSNITTLNNDIAAGTQFNGLNFLAGASAYTINGNGFTLGGNIFQDVNNTQTINVPITLSGNRTIDIIAGNAVATTSGGTLVINGAISDGGNGYSLTLANHNLARLNIGTNGAYGAGTLILTGANTYTGNTNVQVGNLVLNYAAATAPVSNIISGSSPLVLGSTTPTTASGLGILTMTGKASTLNTQAFNNTTIGWGDNRINVTSGATAGASTLTLGTITRSGLGSNVAFALPAVGAIKTNNTLGANGILGGWAMINNNFNAASNGFTGFATVSGGNIVPYTYAVAEQLTGTPSITSANIPAGSNSNIVLSGAGASFTLGTTGTVTDLNTLTFADNTTRAGTLNGTLRVGAQGALFRSDVSGTNATTINGGTITAGGADNTPGELNLITNQNGSNNSVTITITGGVIADNGSGAVTMVKSGRGNLTLSQANTYTGGTYINEGRINTNNGAAFGPDGSKVFIAPGGHILYATSTTSNAYNWYMGGLGSTENAGFFGAMRFNNSQNSIIAGTINLVGDTRVSANGAGGGGISAKITGPYGIQVGSSFGIGTTSIGGEIAFYNTLNDYTGNTTIGAATLGSALTIANDEVIPDGLGKGVVVFNQTNAGSAALNLNGHTETVNALSVIGAATNSLVINNRAGTTGTLLIGSDNSSSTYPALIQNGAGIISIGKVGTGTLTLTGTATHTGMTNVNAGTLALAMNGNQIASSPISVNTGGNLNVNAVSGGFSVGSSQTILANGGNVYGTVTANAGTISGNGGTYTNGIVVSGGTANAGSAPGLSIGAFNTASLSSSGGTVLFEIDGANSDKINVSGAATFTGGGIGMSLISAPTAPFYDVMTYGSLSGTPTLLTTALGRTTFNIDPNPPANTIRIDAVGSAANLTWNNTGLSGDGKTWDIQTSKNWQSVTTFGDPNEFYTLDTVNFTDSNNGNYTVNIANTVTPGNVIINNSNGSYNFSGSGITGRASLVKSGTGALTMAMDNSFTGGMTLNAGTFNINSNTAIGAGTFTINGGTIDAVSGDATFTNNNKMVLGADLQFIGTNNLTTGNGAVVLNANPTINVQNKTLVIGGIISDGTGNSITKTGPGTLSLNGASTYSGITNINAGTVIVTNSNSLGALPATPAAAGTVNIASGAVLDLGVGTATTNNINFGQKQFNIIGDGINGSGALTNSVAVRQQNAFQRVTLTGDATVGGVGSFDIRGTQVAGVNQASLDLAGHNLNLTSTYHGLVNVDVSDGNLNLNSGTLQFEVGTNVASLSAGKSITLANSTYLQFFNYVGTLTRPIIDNGATFGPNTNTASVVGSNITLNGDFNMTPVNANGTGSLTVNGNIVEASSGKAIIKNNNGTGNSLLLLAGNNTFTGGVNVNGGTVQVGSTGALNATTPQLVQLNNPSTGSGLRLAGFSPTVAGLTGGNNTAVENASSTPATLTIANSGDQNFDGTMRNGGSAGSASLAITKAGGINSTYTLNGTSTYTGNTTINAGTIQLGNGGTSGAIAATSTVTGTSSGTFAFNRTDAVTIADPITGSVNVFKNGGNTVTYSGANTSSGVTTVNNGAMIVSGSISGPVNLQNGTLSGTGDGVTGGIVGNLTLDGSSKLRIGATPNDGSIGTLKAASVTNNGEMRFDIGGATGDQLNVTGNTNFASGSISLSLNQAIPAQSSYVLIQAGSITGTPTLAQATIGRTSFSIDAAQLANKIVQVDITGNPNHLIWVGNLGSGAWENTQQFKNWTNTDQANAADFFFDGDFVTFPEAATARTVSLNNNVSPNAVAFSHVTGNYTINGNGNGINGLASITISGGGAVVFNNMNNNYIGPTLIQNGTLVLGSTNALPNNASVTLGSGPTSGVLDMGGNSGTFADLSTSGTGAGNIVGNSSTSSASTINFNGGSSTFGGVIQDTLGSGNQTVAVNVNSGTLILAGNSTYTGPTTINGSAALQLGAGTTTGSVGNTSLNDNGLLIVNRSDTVTLSGQINGGGGFQTIGSGTTILTNNNGFSGPVTIGTGSTLKIGAGTTTGAIGSGAITDSGTLIFERSDDQSIGNAISGTGNVVKNGSGSFTFTSANTYSGMTIVNAGTMGVPASANLGTSSVTINAGGAFDARGINLSAHSFFIAGAGDGQPGSAALFSAGGSQTTSFASVTLIGDATIKADDFGQGGTFGRTDIRSGPALLDLAGHTLTKIGNAQFSVVAGSITSGTIEVNAGNFAIQTTTTAKGTGLIEVNASTAGTMLTFWQNAVGNITMPIRFNGDGNIIGNAASGAGSLATVSSPITLNGNLIISNAIPNNATQAPITLAGAIGEVNGPHSVTLQAASNGPITATFSGANTYTGGTNVQAGTLLTTTNFSNGTLVIGTASNAAFAQVSAKPSAGSPTGLTLVPAISILSNGTFDLTNNALAVDYPVAGPTPFTDIRNFVISGRNNGTWDGAGIQSSTAKAVAADNTNLHKTALGYGEASTLGVSTFDGANVDSTTVLVRYTLVGDANLDGKVNALDFNAIATNFGKAGANLWTQGDDNFDGVVDTQDFTALGQNFGFALPSAPVPAPGLGSLVPEPSSMLLLASGVLMSARRRKR